MGGINVLLNKSRTLPPRYLRYEVGYSALPTVSEGHVGGKEVGEAARVKSDGIRAVTKERNKSIVKSVAKNSGKAILGYYARSFVGGALSALAGVTIGTITGSPSAAFYTTLGATSGATAYAFGRSVINASKQMRKDVKEIKAKYESGKEAAEKAAKKVADKEYKQALKELEMLEKMDEDDDVLLKHLSDAGWDTSLFKK